MPIVTSSRQYRPVDQSITIIVRTTNDFGFWSKCQNENFQMRTELYPESWCLISRSPTGQSRTPKSTSRTLKSISRTLMSNMNWGFWISCHYTNQNPNVMHTKWVAHSHMQIQRHAQGFTAIQTVAQLTACHWLLTGTLPAHNNIQMSGSQPHTSTHTCAESHSHTNSSMINCLSTGWLLVIYQCSTNVQHSFLPSFQVTVIERDNRTDVV